MGRYEVGSYLIRFLDAEQIRPYDFRYLLLTQDYLPLVSYERKFHIVNLYK